MKKEEDDIRCGILIGILLTVVTIILGTVMREKEPRAIDVYRGKTTLKITYKDGVAIDSVVVYK